MGCGTSKARKDMTQVPELSDLKLTSCRLAFSQRQFLKLNEKFSNFFECKNNSGRTRERQIACIDVVVERLVQRLICNVGNFDPRFSSKFLINLEPRKNTSNEPRKNLKYKYLVRLDVVSTPALYPDFFEPPVRIIEGADNESLPQGYARIRVHGEFLEQWTGFISPNGFLRRDKIQERFVELLARAAARPTEPSSPDQVDESRYCGSPGKIVDPITLHHILKTPPSHQVFFGPAECDESRFPDPRDFRIAIVEGIPETRLHISFLSPTAQSITAEEDVEISVTLGIGVAGWPVGSDFPSRLPLDHVDFILGYRASQLDYYLVPKGPHSSIRCENRSSLWEVRALATEMFLEEHYSPTSVIVKVHKTLLYLMEMLKARGVKTINRYILKNLLFFELEEKKRMQDWAPRMLSRRVLSILDRLLVFLRNQMAPSYIFTAKNLLLQDDALEDDYVSDGDILEHYIKQLFHDEFKTDFHSDCTLVKNQMENAMLQKWDLVVANMSPSMSNRGRRFGVVNNSSASISYTRQQIEYIALLLREVLTLKNIQGKTTMRGVTKNSKDSENKLKNREDFIYLLQIMFDQAKQKLLPSALYRPPKRKSASKKSRKLDRVILSYDISTALLVDDIRRSNQMDFDFTDDMSIVVKIMECLYKAIDSDGRILGPVLRPYLNQIFKGSHENCWFLFEWKKKTDLSEFRAIGAFSDLVLSGSVDPLDGIINSASKGWTWANNCLQIMQAITEENSTRVIIGEKLNFNDSGLRLVFTPSPAKTIRYNVSMVKSRGTRSAESLTKSSNEANEKNGSDSRYATIKSFQDIIDSAICPGNKEEDFCKNKELMPFKNLKIRNEKQPPHIQLRNGNPFTSASMEVRRQGNHRGLGSIVQALISLQKLTVLQEISQYLPESERARVLSDIKKLSKEIQRLAVENYRKKTFSFSSGRNRFSFRKSTKTLPARSTHKKRISEVFPTGAKGSEPQGNGIFRSVNEFSIQSKEGAQKDLNTGGRQGKQEGAKEETLLGTCRLLRREYRPTVFDRANMCNLPKAGRYRGGSSTLPQSILKTPFYIKISSYSSDGEIHK